jgi:hypothetical protein
VELDRPADQPLDLLVLGDVGLHRGFGGKTEFGGQSLQPVEPAHADDTLRSLGGQPPRGGFAQPAACTCNGDDLTLGL